MVRHSVYWCGMARVEHFIVRQSVRLAMLIVHAKRSSSGDQTVSQLYQTHI